MTIRYQHHGINIVDVPGCDGSGIAWRKAQVLDHGWKCEEREEENGEGEGQDHQSRSDGSAEAEKGGARSRARAQGGEGVGDFLSEG